MDRSTSLPCSEIALDLESDVRLTDLIECQMETLKESEEAFNSYKMKLFQKKSFTGKPLAPSPPKPGSVRKVYGLTQGKFSTSSTPECFAETNSSTRRSESPGEILDVLSNLVSSITVLFDKMSNRFDTIEQRQKEYMEDLTQHKETSGLLKQLGETLSTHTVILNGIEESLKRCVPDDRDHGLVSIYSQDARRSYLAPAHSEPRLRSLRDIKRQASPRAKKEVMSPDFLVTKLVPSFETHMNDVDNQLQMNKSKVVAIHGDLPNLASPRKMPASERLSSHTTGTLLNAIYDMSANQDSMKAFCECLTMCVCHIASSLEATFSIKEEDMKGLASVAHDAIAFSGKEVTQHEAYDPKIDCLEDGGIPTSVLLIPMRTEEDQVCGILRVYNKMTFHGKRKVSAPAFCLKNPGNYSTARSMEGVGSQPQLFEERFTSMDEDYLKRLLAFACPMLTHVLSKEQRRTNAVCLANLVEILNILGLESGDSLLAEVEAGAKRLTSATHATVYLYEGKGDYMIKNGKRVHFDDTNGITPYVIDACQIAVIANVDTCESFQQRNMDFTVTNIVVVPIAIEDNVMGVIELYNMPPEILTEFTNLILKALSKFLAITLTGETGLQLLEEEKSRSTIMVKVCKEIAAVTLDAEALHNNIMEHARTLVNADRAALFIADWKRKVLFATFGGQSVTMPINKGIAGTVAMTGLPLSITDAYTDTRFNKNVDVKSGYCTKTILSMPVKCDGRVVAVAQLINKRGPEGIMAFGEEDEQTLETFTTFAGIALRISEQYKTLSKERQRASAMLDAVAGVADTDIREGSKTICCNIMHQAKTLIAADRCSLFMIDKEQTQLYSCVTDQQGGEIRVPLHTGIAGEVARRDILLNIPDAYKDKRFNTEQDRLRGYVTKSILAVPVRGEGEVLAVMQLINKNEGLPFDGEDEKTLLYFSSLAGIIIRNTQLYEFATQGRAELSSVLQTLNDSSALRKGDASPTAKYGGSTPEEVRLFERLQETTHDVSELEKATTTQFDIHQYMPQEEGLPKLLSLVSLFFEKRGLFAEFCINDIVMHRFLSAVACSYRHVPYHNIYHAVDVTQTIYVILNQMPEGLLTKLEEFVLLLCGVIHDVDHMGLNNSFHYKAETPLGILSNATGGTSALEIHHCDVAIAILQRPECNIFSSFPNRAEEIEAYKMVVKCVLATDMALHQDSLNRFSEIYTDERTKHKEQLLLIILKAADISNVTKPFDVSRNWAYRVLEEFYFQGDLEVRDMGQVSNEMFDRNSKKEIAEGQLGFIRYFAKPFFAVVRDVFPELESFYTQLCSNENDWSTILERDKEKKAANTELSYDK